MTPLAILILQLADGRQIMGLLGFPNCMIMDINGYTYIHIYPIGSVSPWRTLTNTLTKPNMRHKMHENEFCKLSTALHGIVNTC